jgi:hypothetical protein
LSDDEAEESELWEDSDGDRDGEREADRFDRLRSGVRDRRLFECKQHVLASHPGKMVRSGDEDGFPLHVWDTMPQVETTALKPNQVQRGYFKIEHTPLPAPRPSLLALAVAASWAA